MGYIGLRILRLIVLLGFSVSSFALPFNITPAIPLPIFIAPDNQMITAYTVENNTISQRNNNFVKYLPPNVSVIPGVGCSASFNLAPKGQLGSSCTLFLNVTGPVDARDTNSHHHLFVCFPGGTTCAGTRNPLNVTLSSSLKRFAYIANHSSANTISICPVLPNGNLSACTAHTDPTFFYPIDVILNNAATFAYVANSSDTDSGGSISVCSVNADGSLNPCTATNAPDNQYCGLTLNSTNTLLYYAQYNFNLIDICQVNSNGSLGSCTPYTSPSLDGPTGKILFNNYGTMAYVANYDSNSVSFCKVNSTGQLINCQNFTDPTIVNPLGAAINRANTLLYIFNYNNDTIPSTVSICPINANGSLSQLCAVSTGNGTFNFTDDNAINSVFTTNPLITYVPNGGAPSISICPFMANGLFGNCTVFTDPTLTVPDSIYIATLGQFG